MTQSSLLVGVLRWCFLMGIIAVTPACSADEEPGQYEMNNRVLVDLTRLRLGTLPSAEAGDALVVAAVTVTPIDPEPATATPGAGGRAGIYTAVVLRCESVLHGEVGEKQLAFVNHHRVLPFGDHGHPDCDRVYVDFRQFSALVQVSVSTEKVVGTYVIPAAWSQDLAEAYRYCRRHPSMFGFAAAPRDFSELSRLLSGTNPFLAIASARVLASSSENVPIILKEARASAGMRKSAILCALLTSAPVDVRTLATLHLGVQRILLKGERADDLAWVGLAIRGCGQGLAIGVPERQLLGAEATAPSVVGGLSAAERLQPTLFEEFKERAAIVNSASKDQYLALLSRMPLVLGGETGSQPRAGDVRPFKIAIYSGLFRPALDGLADVSES